MVEGLNVLTGFVQTTTRSSRDVPTIDGGGSIYAGV